MRVTGLRRGCLAVTTAAALVLIVALATVLVQPIDPACPEYCDLEQVVATAAIALVALTWLVVVLLIAWGARGQDPGLAAAAAVAAAVLQVVMAALDTMLWLTPSLQDSQVWPLDELTVVLAMGVQLPAIWRLAARAQHQAAGRLAIAVTGLAALAAAVAFVALGATMVSQGSQVEFVAYLAFSAGLAVLAAGAWATIGPARPGVALVGGAALFYAAVGGWFYLSPTDANGILLLAAPIAALGWLWIGWTWLRPSPA